jgi:hypothetical protein
MTTIGAEIRTGAYSGSAFLMQLNRYMAEVLRESPLCNPGTFHGKSQ